MREWIVTWLKVMGIGVGIQLWAVAFTVPAYLADQWWGGMVSAAVFGGELFLLFSAGITTAMVINNRDERESAREQALDEAMWERVLARRAPARAMPHVGDTVQSADGREVTP